MSNIDREMVRLVGLDDEALLQTLNDESTDRLRLLRKRFATPIAISVEDRFVAKAFGIDPNKRLRQIVQHIDTVLIARTLK